MKIILCLLFLSSFASAERLENVKILDVKPGDSNVKLKMQMGNGAPESYFFIDITKNDPESFEKMILVFKKMLKKDQLRLDLNIPSFSASPSGSYYKSNDITFFVLSREPNEVKIQKKNKK